MAFGAFVPSIRARENPRLSASGNGCCVLTCFRFLQELVSLDPCLLESRFHIFKPVVPERFSVFVNGRNRSLWPELLADELDICCDIRKDFINQRCGVYSGEETSGPFFLAASCSDVHITFLARAKLLPGDRRLGCWPCCACYGSFRVQASHFCSKRSRKFRYQRHVKLFLSVLTAQYPVDLGGCRYFIIRDTARTTQAGGQSAYPVAFSHGPPLA